MTIIPPINIITRIRGIHHLRNVDKNLAKERQNTSSRRVMEMGLIILKHKNKISRLTQSQNVTIILISKLLRGIIWQI
jgi:prophage tail gpP-like protein